MGFMSLTKAEQREYEQRILELEQLPAMDEQQQLEYENRLLMLSYQHFKDLRLVLDHVGRLPMVEALGRDAARDRLSMKDYMSNYSDIELQLIKQQIGQARRALDWLEVQADAAMESEKVVKFERRVNHG